MTTYLICQSINCRNQTRHFSASTGCSKAQRLSASGELRPPEPPDQGLCPWTPLGAPHPDPRYRLALDNYNYFINQYLLISTKQCTFSYPHLNYWIPFLYTSVILHSSNTHSNIITTLCCTYFIHSINISHLHSIHRLTYLYITDHYTYISW